MTKKVFILLLGLSLCLTNGFADEVPEPIFEFRVPEGDAYIQGNEDIKRAPNYIFGEPDYEKMRDLPVNSQDYQLGRHVGMLWTPVEPRSPRAFICTGFLVGPDLLMTNHHCVHDDFGRPFPLELIEIYMDYYQERVDDPTRGGVTAGVLSIVKADAQLDYALLRLDTPIGNTYGWLELDTTTPANPGQSVKIIHHSSGRSKEISRRNSQIVEVPAEIAARYPFLIGYLADTEGGSSGSPIFLRDGTGVIGINHSGWFDQDGPIFNGGSLMSYIVPQIEQWLPREGTPDLVVESTRVNNAFLRPGESFTLSLTVRNQGTTASPTLLQYYYSTDNTISMDDAPMGTDAVDVLATGETVEKSITLTAPNYIGTYYYGACVDPTANENATYNNCSAAVSVNVSTTPPFWMYWASDGGLLRAANDGTNLQTLQVFATGGCFQRKIALDVEGGKMYWTDSGVRGAGKIQRANFDGSNVEDIITGLPFPHVIALDVASRKMYWIDFDRHTIQRANLDGSDIEDLVSRVVNPGGIALDVAKRKMYWTTGSYRSPGKIWRANLDGTNVEDLVTTRLDDPSRIALDITGGKMYWMLNTLTVDDDDGVIQRANLDGSDVEDLVSGFDSSDGLALDVASGKMYWTQLYPSKIQRANLDGSHVEDLITLTRRPCDLALGISDPSDPDPVPVPVPDDPLDVNSDGQVTAMDLVAVALFYGTQVPSGISLSADVNADGSVDLADLMAVAQGIDAAGGGINGLSLVEVEAALAAAAEQAAELEAVAAAPMRFGTRQSESRIAYHNVVNALAEARHLGHSVPAVLQELLSLLTEMADIPESTALLPNYPNPFNPETWIPYHLATDAEVTVTIYNVRGSVVSELVLGHQPAGVYESRGRAAYWDGKNELGEPVASGVYFYTLAAGDFTATRKLLIAK